MTLDWEQLVTLEQLQWKNDPDYKVLTWSGLTGHGVLLDVRADSVGVVTRLMDPPVRPLAKQNPTEGGRSRKNPISSGGEKVQS